jgi:hypothetical protein
VLDRKRVGATGLPINHFPPPTLCVLLPSIFFFTRLFYENFSLSLFSLLNAAPQTAFCGPRHDTRNELHIQNTGDDGFCSLSREYSTIFNFGSKNISAWCDPAEETENS